MEGVLPLCLGLQGALWAVRGETGLGREKRMLEVGSSRQRPSDQMTAGLDTDFSTQV